MWKPFSPYVDYIDNLINHHLYRAVLINFLGFCLLEVLEDIQTLFKFNKILKEFKFFNMRWGYYLWQYIPFLKHLSYSLFYKQFGPNLKLDRMAV